MAELTRGEKAKQTRIARIGLEAYKAEQANKGKKGGKNSVGQFKANPKIAKKAGNRSKRLPKAILKTPSGVYDESGDLQITPHAKVDDEAIAQLDQDIKDLEKVEE